MARADGPYPSLPDTFARTQLLISDDWLRDALTRSPSQGLLKIVDDRYRWASTLVATQLVVGEWQARFPDPTIGDAISDRLVHNAYHLEPNGE